MLWKIQVLDQVLFARCVSREALQRILQEEMNISSFVQAVERVSGHRNGRVTDAHEVIVDLDRNHPATVVNYPERAAPAGPIL